jgi:hypothetical protein
VAVPGVVASRVKLLLVLLLRQHGQRHGCSSGSSGGRSTAPRLSPPSPCCCPGVQLHALQGVGGL